MLAQQHQQLMLMQQGKQLTHEQQQQQLRFGDVGDEERGAQMVNQIPGPPRQGTYRPLLEGDNLSQTSSPEPPDPVERSRFNTHDHTSQ